MFVLIVIKENCENKNLNIIYKKMNQLPIINLFHVLIVAPLLIYVGYMQNYGETKPARWVYDLLIIIGVFALLYHLYRAWIFMGY